MAIYHCSAKTVSRSSGGTAANAIAYEAGVKLEGPGRVVDFSKKEVLETAIIGTLDDLQTLSDKMELAENRKNSTVARRYIVALPEEISQEEQWKATREFGEFLNKEFGVAVVANLHPPDKGGDQRNYHAHFTTTDRKVDENGNLGAKTRELTCMNKKLGIDGVPRAKANLLKIREQWASIANKALERAGHEEEISHLSYAKRGIKQEPQQHLGKRKTEQLRKGYSISKAEQNRLIQEKNERLPRKTSQGLKNEESELPRGRDRGNDKALGGISKGDEKNRIKTLEANIGEKPIRKGVERSAPQNSKVRGRGRRNREKIKRAIVYFRREFRAFKALVKSPITAGSRHSLSGTQDNFRIDRGERESICREWARNYVRPQSRGYSRRENHQRKLESRRALEQARRREVKQSRGMRL